MLRTYQKGPIIAVIKERPGKAVYTIDERDTSWSGLFVGRLLFAVSRTGTPTVFDNEITYWMQLEVSTGAREKESFNDKDDHYCWRFICGESKRRGTYAVYSMRSIGSLSFPISRARHSEHRFHECCSSISILKRSP